MLESAFTEPTQIFVHEHASPASGISAAPLNVSTWQRQPLTIFAAVNMSSNETFFHQKMIHFQMAPRAPALTLK